ncbi:MAG: hypothetical protein ACR2HX_19475 [Pyrinomonadaceae bacterium]
MKHKEQTDLSEAQSTGLLEAALEIAERRRSKLDEIKALILAGKEPEAMKLMKTFLGIEPERRA